MQSNFWTDARPAIEAASVDAKRADIETSGPLPNGGVNGKATKKARRRRSVIGRVAMK
jgi:hypothetical protein